MGNFLISNHFIPACRTSSIRTYIIACGFPNALHARLSLTRRVAAAGVHANQLWGDVNMVNGVPWPVMSVNATHHRFRILNAAASRPWLLSVRRKFCCAALLASESPLPAHRLCPAAAVADDPTH